MTGDARELQPPVFTVSLLKPTSKNDMSVSEVGDSVLEADVSEVAQQNSEAAEGLLSNRRCKEDATNASWEPLAAAWRDQHSTVEIDKPMRSLRNPVPRGHSFHGKADRIPVIADSR